MSWPAPKPTWSDERVEVLKKLWREGYSASQIAKTMGGCTRNSVIAKVDRLRRAGVQIGQRATPSAPATVRAKPQTVRPRAKTPAPKGVMILNPVRGGDVATAARMDNIEARANPAENVVAMSRNFRPLPGRDPVPFGSKGCRWPVGGEGADMCCCGAPRTENERGELPYCSDHATVAYQPRPKSKRSAEADLARNLRRYI